MTSQHMWVGLSEIAMQDLWAKVRGTVIEPEDVGYEEARTVYNGMIDRHPAIIVRCVDVADAMSAVNLALHLYSSGGGYINMIMDKGEESGQGRLPRQLCAPGPKQGDV